MQAQKVADKTNLVLKNSIILAVAFLVAKILGAFYRIPLTNILSSEGMGIYQLVFPTYSFTQVILTSGISVAETKLVAKYSIEGSETRCRQIFIASVKLSIYLGLTMAGFITLAGTFVSRFQGLKLGSYLYFTLAACLVATGIGSSIKAYFQGRENMLPTAVSVLCEQVCKLVFGLLLARVLIKFGLEFGVLGALIGVFIGELVVLGVTIAFFKKQKKADKALLSAIDLKENEPQFQVSPTKEIIKTALPVVFASAIVPMVFFIDSMFAVKILELSAGLTPSTATAQYGLLYGVVNSLINMPIIFATAVSSSLLPHLSKIDDGQFAEVQTAQKCKNALFLTVAISLVFAVLFGIFPEAVLRFLYKNMVSVEAVKLLRISSVLVVVNSALAILTSIFQSAGKLWQNFFVLSFCAVVKYIVLTVLYFASVVNIYTLCYLNIIFYSLVALINYVRLYALLKSEPSLKNLSLLSCLYAVLFAGGLVIYRFLHLSAFLTLLVVCSFLGVVFLIFGLLCLKKIPWLKIK